MRVRVFVTAAVCVSSMFSLACGSSGPASPSRPASPAITSVTVTVSGRVEVGGTRQMKAEALYSDGSKNDVTALATWVSESMSLATVAPGGEVRGVAYGRTTITASYQNVTGALVVPVRGRPVQFRVNPGVMRVLGTCDSALEGPGEFAWRIFALGKSGDDQEPLRIFIDETSDSYPSGQTYALERGDEITFGSAPTFRIHNEAGSFAEVTFAVTEWDRSLLPPFDPFMDPRMKDLSRTVRYIWSAANGWGDAFGIHELTLGDGTCGMRLVYDIQISTAN